MLDLLYPGFRPKVVELIAQAADEGIAILILPEASGPDHVQLCPSEIYERLGERRECWPSDPVFRDLDRLGRKLKVKCLGKGLFACLEGA